MGHDHSHAATSAAGPVMRRRLAVVLAVTAALAVAEFAGGLWSGSLTLLADAGHMASDCAALGLALFAAWVAERPAPPRQTFGAQRAEILAAVANAVLLAVVMIAVIHEAIGRLRTPAPPDAGPMFVLGALGLAANLVSIRVLHGHAHTNLNMRGAYLEVAADLLASVGVLAAAVLTRYFGWVHADPVISLGLAAFILPRIAHLLRDATDVLMETAPRDLDLEAVRGAICRTAGVLAVHDLHVWAITPSRICLSAHVVGREESDRDALLSAINRALREGFGIGHTTLQVEGAVAVEGEDFKAGCGACDSPPAGPETGSSARTADATSS